MEMIVVTGATFWTGTTIVEEERYFYKIVVVAYYFCRKIQE